MEGVDKAADTFNLHLKTKYTAFLTRFCRC